MKSVFKFQNLLFYTSYCLSYIINHNEFFVDLETGAETQRIESI